LRGTCCLLGKVQLLILFSNFVRYLEFRSLTRYVRMKRAASVFRYLGGIEGDAFAEHRVEELKLFFVNSISKTSFRVFHAPNTGDRIVS
jgi:hypothetical protein